MKDSKDPAHGVDAATTREYKARCGMARWQSASCVGEPQHIEVRRLALRSLLGLNHDVEFDITILDNASDDETSPLFGWATEQGIAIKQSGFTTSEPANTHGEVLVRAGESAGRVPALPRDTDACFLHPGTVADMQDRLEGDPALFAIQAKVRLYVTQTMGLQPRPHGLTSSRPLRMAHDDGSSPRPHPFCLLVRDTPQFRAVVRARRPLKCEPLRRFPRARRLL